jgi:hypothetical protein
MAEMWSDNADVIIKNVDKDIKAKYKFSLSEFLTNPADYASVPNVAITVSNMKEYVDDFGSSLLGGLDEEKKKLDDDAMKCDAVTSQIAQAIKAEARQSKIPIIKPATVLRDENKEEVIYVKDASGDILGLVGRLVDSSLMIADFTRQYENYQIGEWLFSGNKNYVLRVSLDPNPYLNVEASVNEINGLLDAAADYLKSLIPPKSQVTK